jgi:hypothetical protein
MPTSLRAPQEMLPPHGAAFPYDMPDLERVPGALSSISASPDVPTKLAHIRDLWPKLQSLHDLNIEYERWMEQQQLMETRVQEYSESAQRRLRFVEDGIAQEEARFLQEIRAVTRMLDDPLGTSAVAQAELKHVVELFGHIQRRIVEAARMAQTTVSLARTDLAGETNEADTRYVSTAFVREVRLLLAERKEREEAAVQAHESYARLMAGYEYSKLRRQAKATSNVAAAPPLLPTAYLASNLLIKQADENVAAASSSSSSSPGGVKKKPPAEEAFDLSIGDDLQQSVSLAQQRSQLLQKAVYELDDRLRQVTLKYRMAAMRTLATTIQQQLRYLQDRIDGQSGRVRAAFQHVIRQYTNSASEIARVCEQFQESATDELTEKLAEYAEVERLLSERSDLLQAMDNNWPTTMAVDFGARLTEKLDAMAIQQGFGSYHMSARPSPAELNTLQSEVFRTAGGFVKRAFQRIHKPLASFDLPYRGLCTVGGTGSAKTTSLLENFWSVFDASIAGKTTVGQRWMLIGLPSFLQANEWLNSINASRDLKYGKVDTSAKRYTKLGPNTAVLTVPLPGVVLGADAWDHPDAVKLVFQVMSGSLPTENRRVNLARRWAEMAPPGQTWFDRFRNGKELGLKQRSLEVDYETDEVYASLTSKERAELSSFQKHARDRLLGGMRRSAGRQNAMRRASAVEVIGQLGICLPPGGHAIFDEAHLLIDPRRPTATENTKVFHWNVAIENSDDERIWTMTGTPGNTLIDMSNLVNKHRRREDERVLSTRMRESAPKRPEKGSDDERRKDLYARATRCEEMYLQNKYFAYDKDGRPLWRDGMEYKYTLLHVGYISYITIQHDLTIYPQIDSEFPHLKDLEVRGAATGSTPLPESLRLELARERPTELFFDVQKRVLQRVDPSLVLPYSEDDRTALEAQDLGHFRPLEVLVPLNDEAEAELRKKMAEDVGDKTRARYRGSSACQGSVPTERFRGETDVEFAARQWLRTAECMDYVHPDLKSGMRRDPGLVPYRSAIPNKVLVLQSLATMFADLGRKVFLFAMLDSKYAAYAIEPTVKTFLCSKHPQSLKTFVPFELVNAATMGSLVTKHADLIRKHAEKQPDRIKDWARAVSDAWYQTTQDALPPKDAGHTPRLIMFRSIKASKGDAAEDDGASSSSSSSSGGAEESQAEAVKSAKLDAKDQALINEALRLVWTDPRNEHGSFVRWFVGDANANTGLNLSGTEVAILAEPIDTSSQQQAFARAFRFIVSKRRWKVLCIVLKSVFQQYAPGDELAEELQRKSGEDILQLPAARPEASAVEAPIGSSSKKKKKKAAPKSLSVDDVVKRGRGALHTPDQILSHRRQLRVTDLALVSWQRAAIDCLFFGEYSKVPGGCFPELAQRLKAKKADGYCYLRAPDGGPAVDASGTPYLRIHSQALLGALQRRVKLPSAKAEGFGDLCHQLNGVLALTNNYTLFDAMLYIALQRPEYRSTVEDLADDAEENASSSEEEEEDNEDDSESEEEDEGEAGSHGNDGNGPTQGPPVADPVRGANSSSSSDEEGEDAESENEKGTEESGDDAEATARPTVPEPAEEEESAEPPPSGGGGIVSWMKSLAGAGWRTAKSAVGLRSRAVAVESASLASLAFLERLLRQTGSETAELPPPEEFRVLLPADRLLLRGILHLKRDEMKDRPTERETIETQATEHMVTAQRKADRVRIKKEIRQLLQSEESLSALEEQILSKGEQLAAEGRATKKDAAQQHVLPSVAGSQPLDATNSGVLTREIDTYLADLFAKKLPQARPFLPSIAAATPWSLKLPFGKQ